jgi:hypothetical protein
MIARREDIPEPFLGNGSVNAFPLLGSRVLIMQQLVYNIVPAEMLYARDKLRKSARVEAGSNTCVV